MVIKEESPRELLSNALHSKLTFNQALHQNSFTLFCMGFSRAFLSFCSLSVNGLKDLLSYSQYACRKVSRSFEDLSNSLLTFMSASCMSLLVAVS